jgi:hypothetical protein
MIIVAASYRISIESCEKTLDRGYLEGRNDWKARRVKPNEARIGCSLENAAMDE